MELISDIELVLARTPEQDWTPVIRGYVTGRLHQLIQALEPYVDGTMGPVSSKHVQNYVAALTLLGRLHNCYLAAQVTQENPDLEQEQKRALLRDKVRAQVRALEARAS